MNYRINSDFSVPFRIFPFLDRISPYKLELTLKVRATFPEAQYGANCRISFKVPRNCTGVSQELPKRLTGQETEYNDTEKEVSWFITKFKGGAEHTLKTFISVASDQHRKDLGPITMIFEVPMYNVSGLQIKYLRISDTGGKAPNRWVRYMTTASSYACRI